MPGPRRERFRPTGSKRTTAAHAVRNPDRRLGITNRSRSWWPRRRGAGSIDERSDLVLVSAHQRGDEAMKALLSKAVGGPETLVLEEIPEPQVGPGQALVQVKAVGVNYP